MADKDSPYPPPSAPPFPSAPPPSYQAVAYAELQVEDVTESAEASLIPPESSTDGSDAFYPPKLKAGAYTEGSASSAGVPFQQQPYGAGYANYPGGPGPTYAAPSAPPAPPPYQVQAGENEVMIDSQMEQGAGLPPAYEDDVSCGSGLKRTQHRLCLLFTLGLWTFVLLRILAAADVLPNPARSNLEMPALFAPVLVVLYLIYIFECIFSSTRAYTGNRSTDPQALVSEVRAAPPIIAWHIQCYHYETRHRTRTVRDSNGNTRTEHYTERVRVNTHAASAQFLVTAWRDGSPAFVPPSYSLTKHKFYFGFSFTNPAMQQRYDQDRRNFIYTNNRDVHYDFSERRSIPGFKKYVLGMRTDSNPPCSSRHDMFWLFSLLGLSWFFRVHLESFTGVNNYTFVKLLDA